MSCGEGNQKRSRKCENPNPAHGGDECIGDSVETKDCKLRECPGTANSFYSKDSAYSFWFGIQIFEAWMHFLFSVCYPVIYIYFDLDKIQKSNIIKIFSNF